MFTEHQQQALNFQHHLSVTANAGAGKTAVLVQRFIDILAHTSTRINEIVAITFTEKAASELRKKIADAVENHIRLCQGGEDRLRYERIRGQLASANIGTIHSFCAQLLREYPVEADVDAAFTVLEGVDQRILEQEALKDTFDDAINDAQHRNDFLDIVRMYGRWNVQRYLEEFLRHREKVERLLKGCLNDQLEDQQILDYWRRTIVSSVAQQLESSRWQEWLQNLLQVVKGNSVQEISSLLQKWNSKLSPEEKIELFNSIMELVYTSQHHLRKEFIGKEASIERCLYDVNCLKEFYGNYKEIVRSIINEETNEADRTLLCVHRMLLRMFNICLKIYEKNKTEYGHLDFDDLQIKALALLQREDIRAKLAAKFKFIMVDEFQDTNRLQYDILRLLVSELRTGNLFIVGDPKQSIYGFRDAEVKVFEEVKKEIGSALGGLKSVSVTHDGVDTNITMGESFRLQHNIVAFINLVFSNIMKDEYSSYEVGYDELIHGRSASVNGNVEVLLMTEAHHDKRNSKRTNGTQRVDPIITECRMITQRLKELRGSGYPIYDKHAGEWRLFHYGDAAILLRTRKHVKELERSFIESRIPYMLSGGIGYYQTQEIYDLYNYFKFLLNPQDDRALAGILRSSFFTVSDVELFEVSLVNGSKSFWEKCQRRSAADLAEPHLHRAVSILSDDLLSANRIPISLLVQRILRQTGWLGTVAGLITGGQHAANISKLVRIAREFEEKGYVTLFDFVTRLRTLIQEQEREGQAPFETESGCVQIMTIHAAKGLEFPVVIIPFTDQKFRYDSAPFIDAQYGIGIKVKSSTDFNEESTPMLYSFLRHSNRQKIEAEEKRIFYVACTRGRDALIFSGRVGHDAHHPSYLQWIVGNMGTTLSLLKAGDIIMPAHALKVLHMENGKYRIKEVPHQLKVSVKVNEQVNIPTYSDQHSSKSVTDPQEFIIGPLKAQRGGEFFSATQIKTYIECPTKYYLKYHLGLPEQQMFSYTFDEDEEPDDRLLGEHEGLLTHAVLQKIHEHQISEKDIEGGINNAIAAHGLGETGRDVVVQTISTNVGNFIRSEFGKRVLSSAEAKMEFTLSTKFGDDFLTGTIDRLYKHNDGTWCILDYKTDKIEKKRLAEHAEIYKPQLAFYALLVSKYYGQPEVLASLLFLRHSSFPMHYTFIGSEIRSFEHKLREVIMNIKAQNFKRPFQECDSCSFKKEGHCIVPFETIR